MGVDRVALAGMVWQRILRPLLFLFDAETAHGITLGLFSWLMLVPGFRRLVSYFFHVSDPRLRVCRFGIEFPNPVGLAAGLDKNADCCGNLQSLGFGFIEVGTLTAQPQPGKTKPRVFRLRHDLAVLNRMGFNNGGAAAAAARLARRPHRGVLGINIGKTASVPVEAAKEDYLKSFEQLFPFAGYFAINVSSPNTAGLRSLQSSGALTALLHALIERNLELAGVRKEPPKPILLKISPDLDESQLDDIVRVCLDLHIDGVIVANTTISREGVTSDPTIPLWDEGGISGRPLTQRSRALVASVYRKVGGALPIIGVGGIMTPDDAWEMIRSGASLVQVHTGLVYGGPGLVAAINRHLLARLAERGLTSIEGVVGEGAGIPVPERGRLMLGASANS